MRQVVELPQETAETLQRAELQKARAIAIARILESLDALLPNHNPTPTMKER